MRIAKAIAAALLIAATAAPAVAAWQDQVNDFDRDRLGKLEQSRTYGLMRAEGASPVQLGAIHEVLDPAGGPISARELEGEWQCRQMKLGGLAPAMVYSWFNCRVRQTRYGLYFEKYTGTERMSGYLEPFDGGRLVLMGAISAGDQRPKPYSGGNAGFGNVSTSSDVVGVVSAIGPGHARIEFPFPVIESDFDVMEMRRGGGGSAAERRELHERYNPGLRGQAFEGPDPYWNGREPN
jgi:hypothetical protein